MVVLLSISGSCKFDREAPFASMQTFLERQRAA